MRQIVLLVTLTVLLGGCASTESERHLRSSCQSRAKLERSRGAVGALDTFSNLIESRCYQEALSVGRFIRSNFRNKEYSVTTEVLSVFLPEEETSEYVLESHERAYLSFLMAHAYMGLGDKDAAAVELRQSYIDGKALLYNYGEDPVNSLLLAALWDNLGESDNARPFWKKLSEQLPADDYVREFATRRIDAIDRGARLAGPWRIYALGRFPRLDWEIELTRGKGGYYKVKPLDEFPVRCSSATGVVLSTSSWVDKLGERYASDYHPLLHVKSWVRFPIGIAYGLTTFAAGAGVAVGGCMLDGSAKGNGDLCKHSIDGGMQIASKSGDVVNYALKPDLRHWAKAPSGIMLTSRSSMTDETCMGMQDQRFQQLAFELGRADGRGPVRDEDLVLP